MVYQILSDGIDKRHSLAGPSGTRAGPTSHKSGAQEWGRRHWSEQQQRQRRHQDRTHHDRRRPQAPVGARVSGKPQAKLAFPNLLIALIKLLLLFYDALSLPVYFILQRPDKRRQAAKQALSRQVDSSTWIRSHNKADVRNPQSRWKFMGATVSEVFANSVKQFQAAPCLGYRALVTCPVSTLDEFGQQVFREQSFRSDFTWYTYGQIGHRVQDLASGLHASGVFPMSRAMFLASSCLEWFCMAQACFQLAVQLVVWPEMNAKDLKTLRSILLEAQVQLLFVSCDQLPLLSRLFDFLSRDETELKLDKIVIIDWQFAVDFNETHFAQLGRSLEAHAAERDGQRPQVLSIGQVEEAGIEHPIELRCSRALSDENLAGIEAAAGQRVQVGGGEPAPPVVTANSARGSLVAEVRSRLLSLSSMRKASDTATLPGHWLHHESGTGAGTGSSMSAPMARRRLPAASAQVGGKRPPMDGNSGQLERSLLNAHRNQASSGNRGCQTGLQRAEPRPEDLALIVYTYGPLGQARAIVLTHNQLARSNHQLFLDGLIGPDDAHCAFLPLDCPLELLTELCVFSHGGSIGYSNNLKTLFYDGQQLFERDKSDLEAADPTYLLVRPFILEQLRASLQNYLQLRQNPLATFLLKNVLYDYKKRWAKRHYDAPIVDRLFCAPLKRLFGRRIKHILCKGPTDCSETKDFFAFMLGLPVIELYGPDEAVASMIANEQSTSDYSKVGSRPGQRRREPPFGSGTRADAAAAAHGAAPSNTSSSSEGGEAKEEEDEDEDEDEEEERRKDFGGMQLLPPRLSTNTYRENFSKNILVTSSSIFRPTSGTRIRLEDWEEFRLADRPYPRGRLLIGGEPVALGYLNNEPSADKRPAAFFCDPQGVRWFRTGDIARAFPNGSFEIISAMSNIIKMVDGQFVALSQIELTLRNDQFVDNVCTLCGDDRSSVINLVVPNLRRIALKSPNEANLKMAIGTEPEPDELADVEFRREVCNDRLLCEFVTDHLSQLLASSGLASIDNKFLLVPEIWTPESELVTLAYEPRRQAIQKFYANDIQSLVRLQARQSSSRSSNQRRSRRI